MTPTGDARSPARATARTSEDLATRLTTAVAALVLETPSASFSALSGANVLHRPPAGRGWTGQPGSSTTSTSGWRSASRCSTASSGS
jgi:hypothetical protein